MNSVVSSAHNKITELHESINNTVSQWSLAIAKMINRDQVFLPNDYNPPVYQTDHASSSSPLGDSNNSSLSIDTDKEICIKKSNVSEKHI